MKTKQKKKNGNGQLFDRQCTETANKISTLAKETFSKMWTIGKILVTEKQKVNPKFKGAFYRTVVEKINQDLSTDQLYQCARFYEKYPDFESRASKTGLSGSHYLQLSKLSDKEKRDKFEKKAIEKKWTRNELADNIFEPTFKPDIPNFEQYHEDFNSAFTQMRDNLKLMSKNLKLYPDVDRDEVATTLYVFFLTTLPPILERFVKANAKVHPLLKKMIEKNRKK